MDTQNRPPGGLVAVSGTVASISDMVVFVGRPLVREGSNLAAKYISNHTVSLPPELAQ